jgi:Flp pilus assembly protein TadG
MRSSTQFRNQRGQGLVEFGLLIPFIIFLLIFLVEVGLALGSYMRLLNVSRETSRQIAVHSEEAMVTALVTEQLGQGLNGLTLDYSYLNVNGEAVANREAAIRGDMARVSAHSQHETLTGGLWFPNGLPIRAVSVMMVEN